MTTRWRRLLLAAVPAFCMLGSTSVAQLPTPLIDLDAEGLEAGPVATWANDGSLGGTFNAIVSPQPLYSWNDAPPIAETVDGRAAVTFDNNGLEATVGPPATITGANPVCTVVFQVFNPDYVAGAGGVEITMEWGTRAGAQWAGFGIGNNAWGAASFFGGGRDFSYGGSPPAVGEWQVVFVTVDGSLAIPEITVHVENTQVNQATNTAAPPFAIVGTPFVMGGTRDAGTNRNTTASYARVQVYDSVLSEDQRDELYDELVSSQSSPCPAGSRAEIAGADIVLGWSNGDPAPTSVDIMRNGTLIADDAAADPPEYVDQDVDPGVHVYELTFDVPGEDCDPLAREVSTCIRALSARSFRGEVNLSWANARAYDGIRVLRDGVEIELLAGDVEEYVDTDASPGEHTYTVEPSTGSCDPATAMATVFPPPGPTQLLLYYDFNDASNPAFVVDMSGNGNDGEVFGAQYTDDGDGRTGAEGDHAMDFLAPGDGSYLSVPTAFDEAFATITQNDAVTVSMWTFGGDLQPVNQTNFRFEDDAGTRILSSHAPWGNGNVYFDVGGCCAAATPANRINAVTDEVLYSGEWNHYAFVKDGVWTAIYQNGELFLESGPGAEMVSLSPFQITQVVFGSTLGGAESYHGLLDEIAVWDGALSQEEILDVMENGALGPPDMGVGPFVRGDCDTDGQRNITDGVFLLNFLFLGGSMPSCLAACDNDLSGDVPATPTDALRLFNVLFLGGSPLPDPLECGRSSAPGDVALGCATPPESCM